MPEWDRPETGRTTLTAIHRRLRDLLTRAGFWVQDELQVGKYRIDCYLQEVHLGFEADGRLHHTRTAKMRDRARDEWILDNSGIIIMRLTDRDLTTESDRERSYARILSFIERHGETSEERRQVAIDNLGGVR